MRLPLPLFLICDEFMMIILHFIFACLLASLAIYRHRANIDRLLNGTENKLWKTKKEKEEAAAKADLEASEKAAEEKGGK